MPPSDESTVPPPLSQLHAGEPRAWRQAFALLWGPVLRSARRHLADAGEAEEAAAQALQETRLAAASTRTWEEVGALAVAIARRRAISRGRALSALKRQPGAAFLIDRELASATAEPPQYAALRTLDVQAILADLPPAQRDLLQDYFIEGLTSDEAARKHGMPAATVRSQIMRLLARLREGRPAQGNKPVPQCDSTTRTAS